MLEERQGAFLHSLIDNDPVMPFLKLRVARERVVEDALVVVCLIFCFNFGRATLTLSRIAT